jgi:hypothetical protein
MNSVNFLKSKWPLNNKARDAPPTIILKFFATCLGDTGLYCSYCELVAFSLHSLQNSHLIYNDNLLLAQQMRVNKFLVRPHKIDF